MQMKWIDKDSGPQMYNTVVPDGEWRYEDYDRFLHQPQGYEMRGRITRDEGGFHWWAWPRYPEKGSWGEGVEQSLDAAKQKVERFVLA